MASHSPTLNSGPLKESQKGAGGALVIQPDVEVEVRVVLGEQRTSAGRGESLSGPVASALGHKSASWSCLAWIHLVVVLVGILVVLGR